MKRNNNIDASVNDNKEMSEKEIADALNISQQRVSQIIKDALRKLKIIYTKRKD